MYTVIVTLVNTDTLHTFLYLCSYSLLAQHSYTYTIHNSSTVAHTNTITFTHMCNSESYPHTLTHAALIHALTYTCALNTLRRRCEGPTDWLSISSLPIWCRARILPPHLQMDSDQTVPTRSHPAQRAAHPPY